MISQFTSIAKEVCIAAKRKTNKKNNFRLKKYSRQKKIYTHFYIKFILYKYCMSTGRWGTLHSSLGWICFLVIHIIMQTKCFETVVISNAKCLIDNLRNVCKKYALVSLLHHITSIGIEILFFFSHDLLENMFIQFSLVQINLC